jgi:hypothetical protein
MFGFLVLATNQFKCFWVYTLHNLVKVINKLVVLDIFHKMIRGIREIKNLNFFRIKPFQFAVLIKNGVLVNTLTIFTKTPECFGISIFNNDSAATI